MITITPQQLSDRLKKLVESFGLPAWASKPGKCPECGETLDERAVRAVLIRLNAQHYGNIAIEILCPNCRAGYELHHKKACKTIRDFASKILQDDIEGSTPVPHHKIPPQENNLTELMLFEYATSKDSGKVSDQDKTQGEKVDEHD